MDIETSADVRGASADAKREEDEIQTAPDYAISFNDNIPEKNDYEQQKTIEGEANFHRMGWKRFTVVMMVETIALGSLGLPSVFANLGMVLGQILNVVVALIAVYTAYVIGQVKLKYPHIAHYADIGPLILGKYGSAIFSIIFASVFILNVGSHCLTGSEAFTIMSNSGVCSVVFGVVSAIILFLLAVPPTFTDIAFLAYLDFTSIVAAIGITIIATGVQNSKGNFVPAGTEWSAWPKKDLSLVDIFGSLNGIVFAYGYGAAMPSLMVEMHTPQDYMKSIWVFTGVMMVLYALTGGLIYAFVGQTVSSPALLSAGPTLSRVAFGVALPVVFISGAINVTVVCRFIHGRVYKDSIIRYVNTKKGWITWLGLISTVTILVWIIAEAIPFFSGLLSIQASLFISGLAFYFPPVMWFMLVKEGHWWEKRNLQAAMINLAVFLFGLAILGVGTYASVMSVIASFQEGLKRPFTCHRA